MIGLWCFNRTQITRTCSSSNWSPPNAATQGLIPPVPKAMRTRPTIDNTLWTYTNTVNVGCEVCYNIGYAI